MSNNVKHVTYEQLEDCQTRIYNALQFGHRKDKEDAFGYAWMRVPNLRKNWTTNGKATKIYV